jgi:hypothetical protein
MAFGDIGGATYPQRIGTPQSSVVDYTPKPSDWLKDWQSQYDLAVQAASQPDQIQLLPGAPGYTSGGYSQAGLAYNPYAVDQSNGTYKANPQQYIDLAASIDDPVGKQAILDRLNPTDLGRETPLSRVASLGGSQTAPNVMKPAARSFDDLFAERDAMVPRLENATRQEQAYGQLTGWGQTNGVMSANYGDPDFGAINGNFGQDKITGLDGTQMSSAPTPGATTFGTLSPSPNTNSTIWGTSRKRPTWGI